MNTVTRQKSNGGYTLIELSISMLVTTLVVGAMYAISLSMIKTTHAVDTKVTLRDDGRLAMDFITRNLRMADAATLQTFNGANALVPLGNGIVTNIAFQTPTDLNGNLYAIDQNMNMEWNPIIAVGMDIPDINGNGYSNRELVVSDANQNYRRTLSLNLSPRIDDGNAANVFNAPNGGITFQRVGNGILVTMVLRRQEAPNEAAVVSQISEFVIPRN
jgi:hypothetical protein